MPRNLILKEFINLVPNSKESFFSKITWIENFVLFFLYDTQAYTQVLINLEA